MDGAIAERGSMEGKRVGALRRFLREVTPPFIPKAIEALRKKRHGGAPAWEYMPQGWDAQSDDAAIKGWDVQSILETYKKKWPEFLNNLEGVRPFAFSPEANDPDIPDLAFHNSLMSYAYALARTAWGQSTISMLDWGGGIGHYIEFNRRLFPALEVDYHCKELPLLAAYGQELFPEAHFYSDETCLQRKYDFVVSSSSLQYARDWRDLVNKLASATSGFLFITLLPTVTESASYVMVQRPYEYGYDTEYLGWCINRSELLECAEAAGLELEREFMIGTKPDIHKAPGQCEYRGFLFRPSAVADRGSA